MNAELTAVDRVFQLVMRALRDHGPGAALICIVMGRASTATIGYGNTSHSGEVFIQLCNETDRHHVFGHCPGCDRQALALKAARAAYASCLAGLKGDEHHAH